MLLNLDWVLSGDLRRLARLGTFMAPDADGLITLSALLNIDWDIFVPSVREFRAGLPELL